MSNQPTSILKILYLGPAGSGKATNLKFLHSQFSTENKSLIRSQMIESDKSISFDLKLLDEDCSFILETITGVNSLNSWQKLILDGVDGIVFVADSDPLNMTENKALLDFIDMNHSSLPLVFQYNKRDLDNAVNLEELEEKLNVQDRNSIEAVANEGFHVFSTFFGIYKTIKHKDYRTRAKDWYSEYLETGES